MHLLRGIRLLLCSGRLTLSVLLLATLVGVLANTSAWQLRNRSIQTDAPQTVADTRTATPSDKATAKTADPSPTAEAASAPAPTSASKTAPSRPATSAHQLIISPTSIVIYKIPLGPNPTIKTETFRPVPLTISTADGKSVMLPFAEGALGVLTTTATGSEPFRPSWSMQAYGTYASVGTFDYTVTSRSSNGITYSGKLHAVVKPLPLFSIDGYALNMYVTGDNVSLYFEDGQPAYFDFSTVQEFMPTLTISGYGESCTVSLEIMDDSACGPTDGDLPPGTYEFTAVFENEFQRIELPLFVYVS